jgi:beta-galactosidase
MYIYIYTYIYIHICIYVCVCIYTHTGMGREFWGYGGDFGEPIHDAQFNINGLVFPNREFHPGCVEVKKWYQPFAVSAKFEGKLSNDAAILCALTFQNRHDFATFSSLHLVWEWSLELEGQVVERCDQPQPLPPAAPNGGSAGLAISLSAIPSLEEGHEVFLRVNVLLGRTETWAEKGFCIGVEQMAVSSVSVLVCVCVCVCVCV